jgi:hypothetical protein
MNASIVNGLTADDLRRVADYMDNPDVHSGREIMDAWNASRQRYMNLHEVACLFCVPKSVRRMGFAVRKGN